MKKNFYALLSFVVLSSPYVLYSPKDKRTLDKKEKTHDHRKKKISAKQFLEQEYQETLDMPSGGGLVRRIKALKFINKNGHSKDKDWRFPDADDFFKKDKHHHKDKDKNKDKNKTNTSISYNTSEINEEESQYSQTSSNTQGSFFDNKKAEEEWKRQEYERQKKESQEQNQQEVFHEDEGLPMLTMKACPNCEEPRTSHGKTTRYKSKMKEKNSQRPQKHHKNPHKNSKKQTQKTSRKDKTVSFGRPQNNRVPQGYDEHNHPWENEKEKSLWSEEETSFQDNKSNTCTEELSEAPKCRHKRKDNTPSSGSKSQNLSQVSEDFYTGKQQAIFVQNPKDIENIKKILEKKKSSQKHHHNGKSQSKRKKDPQGHKDSKVKRNTTTPSVTSEDVKTPRRDHGGQRKEKSSKNQGSFHGNSYKDNNEDLKNQAYPHFGSSQPYENPFQGNYNPFYNPPYGGGFGAMAPYGQGHYNPGFSSYGGPFYMGAPYGAPGGNFSYGPQQNNPFQSFEGATHGQRKSKKKKR